ncbi:sugar ABC transporter ATP-binding protein [Nitratireductor mangrovi]|uniref:Sugar ABC transporter ATP-binding protein n=1 Tax=Nitratireductor mangrovi TaxID=2599600 RepID=A0A5B8KXU7_9HYPH|nr:sugar ABC transporter ATP-binding protein [Nitratireductor mangrovi]QDZ00402.1 sugar ABC transporter ATP-binding protein [Nitratireductor mangrovi]
MKSGFTISLSGITKVYPGVVALDDVDLIISAGEIVGLIGENGAGKSTLMKVLGGSIAPDRGRIEIDGQGVASLTPAEATARGIAFVHQELNPFTNLDVAGNILLGREITRGPLGSLDRRAMARAVRPILDMLAAPFGPDDPVSGLSLAEQQLLEIARALSIDARLVIMDEPTSSLTLSETQRLLGVMRELRERGVAVLFISHRLNEIEAVADRVSVLRDGRNAGELAASDINRDRMIGMMIGRDLNQFYDKPTRALREPVLEIGNLATLTFPNARASITVHKGEILGLAGLVGAGRTELARAIFGIDPVVGGAIHLDGRPLPSHSVAAAIKAGICLVPEDRKGQGLHLDFSIAENIALPSLPNLSSGGTVVRSREVELAEASRERFGIRAASVRNPAAELSGGNQQKVVLAKWLALEPRLLIIDEPTRGIDVGAKAEVYRLLRALADRGVGILMISSDMEELIGVASRVAVMRRGEITGILEADELTELAILNLAVG